MPLYYLPRRSLHVLDLAIIRSLCLYLCSPERSYSIARARWWLRAAGPCAYKRTAAGGLVPRASYGLTLAVLLVDVAVVP
jgi:hypothetical protein